MAASSASVTNTQQSNDESNDILKRKSNDLGWEYGVLVDPNNLDKIKCLLCDKVIRGGIYRMKQHIAGIKGNVRACLKSTKEDQLKCRNAINDGRRKKDEKKEREQEVRSQVILGSDMDIIIHEDDDLSLKESIGSKFCASIGPMDKFATQINPEEALNKTKNMRDQNIKGAICKEKLDRVKEYVCRFAYEAGLPFNIFELDSCKRMFEAIGQYGTGCRPPSRYELSETFLKKEVEKTKHTLKPHEEEWKVNGCSIMTDAWSDRKRRSIMNLCVNSRLGTIFVSSKDFSDISHTGQVIHDYVEKCIQEVSCFI